MKSSRLYLLTAPSGAGKTTLCQALAEHARSAGWDVAGLLSPPRFEDGRKSGIYIQDLRSGERCLLAIAASQAAHATGEAQQAADYDLCLGRWRFSMACLSRGNAIFATSLPADLFIVDELGPLELTRGAGWQNAVTALRSQRYTIGVVVVRPELIEEARSQMPITRVISVTAQPALSEQALALWQTIGKPAPS